MEGTARRSAAKHVASLGLTGLLVYELYALLQIDLQVASGLGATARSLHTAELAKATADHVGKTKERAARLKLVLKALGPKLAPVAQPIISALLDDISSRAKLFEKGNLRDAALLNALQRLEQYHSAACSSTLALAKQLGEDQIVELLKEETSQDELMTKRFAQIAIQVNAEAFIDTESERARPVFG
jgi:ferritin-like metal-binding protein YciE